MNKLLTKNLTLREFTVSDSYMYYKNNQDEQIQKYMSFRSYTDESKARDSLERLISNYSTKQFPYNLAIIKTDIDRLIGHIGLGELDIGEGDPGYEIEYAISKNFRGFHYATEALKAFVPWCKSEFNLDKIYALVNQQNIPSCKALLNAGFALFEGEFPKKKSTTNVYIF